MPNKSRLLSIRPLSRRRLTAEDVDETYARCIETMRQLIRQKLSVLPEDSARRATLERLAGLSDEALLDDLFSNGNPNPERRGCPSRDVLVRSHAKNGPLMILRMITSRSVRLAGSKSVI